MAQKQNNIVLSGEKVETIVFFKWVPSYGLRFDLYSESGIGLELANW